MEKNNENLVKPEKKKFHIDFSKIVTAASVILSYLFVLFVCYEMHVQQSLEPVAYIGVSIVLMLSICVRSYMKRAYQKDLVHMKVNQARDLSQIKKEYGEDFVYEDINDVDVDGSGS